MKIFLLIIALQGQVIDEEQDGDKVHECNNELLYSYGILNSGYKSEKSLLCQNANKESCCSEISQKLILNQWNNNN